MWRNERIGLIMILATLFVMGIVLFLSFNFQLETRLNQSRDQGIGLARVLSGMSWDELVPDQGKLDILLVLMQGQNNPDFAYAVVINIEGESVSEVATPGVIIPNTPVPSEPATWIGEREVETPTQGRPYIEFHAPVFSIDNIKGYIRIGYKKPTFGVRVDELPYFATLVLPVFLLTPLFYFLMYREIRPLKKISDDLEQILDGDGVKTIKVEPSGEMMAFMERFSRFVDTTQNRIHTLEDEQKKLLTSTKLLSYKHSKIESILQTIPEAIMVIDEAGSVSYANEKVSILLGIVHAKVIGKKPHEWCKNQNFITYLSRQNSNADHVGYISDSIQISPEHDKDKLLEVKAYPLFSPKDNAHLLGNMVVIRDCTEEKLIRRGRGEFVAQVAHELKTPLNVLAMYSESLLGEDGNSEDFRVEAVNVIHDEVERLSTLINNMLALTKFELGGMHLNRQRVRLHELLEDTFKNIAQSGRGKGYDFELDLPKEMSAIFIDKDLLRIAVNNLLTNAIKYNRSEGKVVLSAEEMNGVIEISVQDTGLGISLEDQNRIFEKFYRSDDEAVRQQTGHGLGLPLVQQIIQMHHGELSVESEYGKGSRFIIHLGQDAGMFRQAGAA